MDAVLSVDIGTSSTRAALVDRDLHVLAIGSSTYRLHTSNPGWAEQDPSEIITALDQAIKQCVDKAAQGVHIRGLCLDTALHSLLALDADGAPLTGIWTWADMRAARTAFEIGQETDGIELYRRTGCPLHAMYFPAKLAWMRKHLPDVFDRARHFTSIKGYVLRHLTGANVDDLSVASGYGLLNLRSFEWDPDALTASRLTADRLPALVEPNHVVGKLQSDLAASWGIPELPVIAGGSDGPLANVGAGCVARGDMAITVGTSSAVRMFSSSPMVDESARTWCYYLGDQTWVVGGAINGGASTLDWLRRTFPGLTGTSSDPYEALGDMAKRVGPGSDGLIIAPYLAGERNPGLQGEARGYIAGMSLHHTAAHFVRAVMEGISYQIAWVYESVAEVAGSPGRIRITGGFVDSEIWPQILADVLGRELEVPSEKEGSLVGCAAFGHDALDPKCDWRTLAQSIPVQKVIRPDMAAHRTYRRFFDAYKRLYASIKPQFSDLAALQAQGD